MMEFINERAFYHTSGTELYNEALMSRYRSMLPASDSAVLFLLATDSDFNRAGVYGELLRFSQEHPAYAGINAVTNRINAMGHKGVELSYNTFAVPGTPVKVKVAAETPRR